MVTFDTSALLASFDKKQAQHDQIRQLLLSDPGPFIVPVGIMSEVSYFLQNWLGHVGLKLFLDDIRDDSYRLHCDETNLLRIIELTDRYRDLPLGYADAAVIACAERHGGKVATLDHRHFRVVAGEGSIEIVP